MTQLTQDGRNAARGVKVLHIGGAGRLEIDQDRRRVAELVHPAKVDRQAETPSDGGQMNEGVGRSAERQQNAQRVLDRLFRDNPAWAAVRVDELHRDSTGFLSDAKPIGVYRRNSGRARGHHAERLNHRRHGAGCAHDPAGSSSGSEAAFDPVDVAFEDFACPILRQ